MKCALAILGMVGLLISCQKDSAVRPGEVEAVITGYTIADYWAKGCSVGGLEIKIGNEPYVVSHPLSTEYEDAYAWPIRVWVRYESAPPDNCAQWTNRISIISIRKR